MDSIAQQNGMASLEQTIEGLQRAATESKKPETATIKVNERTCVITATCDENEKVEITAKYTHTPLGSRICQEVAKFPYDKSDIGNEIKEMVNRIREIDQTNTYTKTSKFAEFITTLDEYTTNGIDIANLPTHMIEINKTLDNMLAFVLQNDLSPKEISSLKVAIVNFGSNKEVVRFPDQSLSINESDHDFNCLEIALRIEAVDILLDAKKKGYVGLERNGPTRTLGKGQYNTVWGVFTKKDGQGPIAIKSCDLFKIKKDKKAFAQNVASMKVFNGHGSGSYRRNKATSKVQYMFHAVGKTMGIDVPHVAATVSAGEINGVPCIAIEELDDTSLWQNLQNLYNRNPKSIIHDENVLAKQIMRDETWLQLQDVLTGQIDRHANNVTLIPMEAAKKGRSTKNARIVAFDHDMSFPTNPPRSFASIVPESIVSSNYPAEVAFDGLKTSNYCMPCIIDTDMFNVIMAIDLNKLENMYKKCGLTRMEISPAMARAQALKNKVRELKQHGLVIKPNEWEQSEKVRSLCNNRNCYARWHIDTCRKRFEATNSVPLEE
ncbi:MAG: hypothetical protein LBD34_03430 [Puniceicoccales bacterium]|jgi:hypothetical protein|nr:hypothetical protein [Puniceicoccales bacterium]